MRLYYDFRFGEDNAGYQILDLEADRLAYLTRFRMGDEEVEASHEIELADGQPVRFRAGGGQWFEAADYPDGAFPAAGIALLLQRMAEDDLDELEYLAIDESSGELQGPTQLRRDGDWILEERAGRVWRSFQLEGNQLVKVDWGGPISTLYATEAKARAGSTYALD